MYHGNQIAGRRRHKVNDVVHLGKLLFQHHHGKHRGSRRHVSRALCHAVRRHHSGSRIALRGTEGNPRLQIAGRVKQRRSLRGQHARLLSRRQYLGQNISQMPAVLPGIFFRSKLVKLPDHPSVKGSGFCVDGEHARCLAHAQHLLPGQLPVDIARKRSQVSNILHMGLLVQNRLTQMGDAPSLGDRISKQFRQLLCSLARHGVSPCTEGHQKLSFPVKRHIAVHHGRKTDGADLLDRHTVLFPHLSRQPCIAVLQSAPDIIQRVCPDSVLQSVLPLMAAGGERHIVLPDQHRLDSGGSQFDPQIRFPFPDLLFHHLFHVDTMPFLFYL